MHMRKEKRRVDNGYIVKIKGKRTEVCEERKWVDREMWLQERMEERRKEE